MNATEPAQAHHIQIPPKLIPLFTDEARGFRNVVIKGGRASGKSWAVAMMILARMMQERVKVLCLRETQTSIAASNWALFRDLVEMLGLHDEFNVIDTAITCKATGAEIIFSGMQGEAAKIRSYEGIGIAWCEEAQQISKRSLETLIPTIRRPGSQLIFTLNPTNPGDAVYATFCAASRPDTMLIHADYLDNPFTSEAIRAEAEWCLATSPDDYAHIWRGECRSNSEAAILAGKYSVEAFDIAAIEAMPSARTIWGVDFGFSRDPFVIARMTYTDDHRLWITAERFAFGVDADDMARHVRDMAGIREARLWCDSASPASIAMLRKGALRAEPAPKWPGSVDDGIRWLRSLRSIVCHPSCKRIAEELRMWSWKVDPKSGEILSVPKSGFDHGMDAVRYAAAGAGLFSRDGTSLVDYERIGAFEFKTALTPGGRVTLERTQVERPVVPEGTAPGSRLPAWVQRIQAAQCPVPVLASGEEVI